MFYSHYYKFILLQPSLNSDRIKQFLLISLYTTKPLYSGVHVVLLLMALLLMARDGGKPETRANPKQTKGVPPTRHEISACRNTYRASAPYMRPWSVGVANSLSQFLSLLLLLLFSCVKRKTVLWRTRYISVVVGYQLKLCFSLEAW